MAKKKDNSQTTGKRKCAIARVIVKNGEGKFTINGKLPREYFGNRDVLIKKLEAALELTGNLGKKDIQVRVSGGGLVGQASAVAHAISRSLAATKDSVRKTVKAAGMLTRDSRVKERKKYGRKKARKRFQFSKR